MELRKAAFLPALALSVFVGCQGGDASDSFTIAPTSYTPVMAYGDDADHPVLATTTDVVTRDEETKLEDLINAHRNALGRDALQILPELKELALAHSIHMGRHEPAFFDHRSPEGDVSIDRAALALIEFTEIGENIAAGQSAADAVFRSWLDSPGHRANLEDPKWTHMGAGHALLPESPYVTYWTLDLIQR